MGGRKPGPLGQEGHDVTEPAPPPVRGSHRAAAPLNGRVGQTVSQLADYRGPRLLLHGEAAMRMVPVILRQARPITVNSSLGPVELRPGTVWRGNRMLLEARYMTVWYSIDDRIYEYSTGDFVRNEWLDAFAEGGARAGWLVPIYQVLMGFGTSLLMGIYVPFYVMMGLACAQATLNYYQHEPLFNAAGDKSKVVLDKVLALREKHPALFKMLAARFFKELLDNLVEGITAEHVGFLIGRCIRGVKQLAEVTLKHVIKALVVTIALVATTKLPSITQGAIASAAADHAEKLRQDLEAAGFKGVTRGEAEAILKSTLADPQAKKELKELQKALEELAPVAEQLQKAMDGD